MHGKSNFSFPAYYLSEGSRNKEILKQAKARGEIIYGARAIQKQIGASARRTKDYDIFDNNPREAAERLKGKIDRLTPGDDVYVKKGINKTTWKVRNVGLDGKKDTSDDISIADYTKTPKPIPKTVIASNGIRYRSISEELRAKARLIADTKFEYRRMKDLDDLRRIKNSRRVR